MNDLGITLDVIVQGPGGCINGEAEMIKRALELAGFTVNVNSNYPTEEQIKKNSETVDDMIARTIKLNKKPRVVNMKVDHLPWGG